ncbi:MAG: DoxX family protein [Armatimonadetes bacterium]|nr:DoxX family protein [Armatimonadota bacterium]MDE2206080.1 DoxX family protein [Armatimonadota bacterium]
MNSDRTSDGKRTDVALLLIRLGAAAAFLYHGSGILFNAFDGPGIAGFAQFMHQPPAVAALVGIAEFAGGVAMLTGILARPGAAGILLVMLGAIATVHWPKFDIAHGGMEYALTQALVASAILVAGPGSYRIPVEQWMRRKRSV